MQRERLPVLQPWGHLAYLAPVAEVRQLIWDGLARPFGPRRRLDGCVLTEAIQPHRPSPRYVRRVALSESVRNILELRPITHLDRHLFREVELSCHPGAPSAAAKTKKKKKASNPT